MSVRDDGAHRTFEAVNDVGSTWTQCTHPGCTKMSPPQPGRADQRRNKKVADAWARKHTNDTGGQQ